MGNSFQEELEKPEFDTLATLAEGLVYRLPGCDDLMLRKTIREVYREFCDETKCLCGQREIALEEGVAEYPVAPLFGGVVTEVRYVYDGDRFLKAGRAYRAAFGNVAAIELLGSWIPKKEDEGKTLFVEAVEIPRLEDERCPRWFIGKHGDAIQNGVLARLCAMTGRAWTDASVAADARVRYENAKSELRMRYEMPQGGNVIDTRGLL